MNTFLWNYNQLVHSTSSNLLMTQFGSSVILYRRLSQGVRDINSEIEKLEFSEFPEPEFLKSDSANNRLQAIKVLFNTERNYLQKMKFMLTEVYYIFLKESKKLSKRLISSNEIETLIEFFPELYFLHYEMNKKLQTSNGNVYDILMEFLTQPKVLCIYSKYIEKCSTYMSICFSMRIGDFTSKYPSLIQLEQIVMMPIQRFPQFECAIGDIFKNTPNTHPEKAKFYRVYCLTKSITQQLDRLRKIYETSQSKESFKYLRKYGSSISSEKIYSKNSVNFMSFDFSDNNCKLVKHPYFLLLCDKEIIFYPRDLSVLDYQENCLSVYPIKSVEFQFQNVSNIKRYQKSIIKLDQVREIFQHLKDSEENWKLLKETNELINDYDNLIKIIDGISNLNYPYEGLDVINISKSLLRLEEQLSSNERKINKLLTSILTLKIKINPDKPEQDLIKIFHFDSVIQANSWKVNFYRTKLQEKMTVISEWGFFPSDRNPDKFSKEELPLLAPEFVLNKNSIVNVTCNVARAQVISIIVGQKIFRCIWCYMECGLMLILHFDYNEWTIFESINSPFKHSVLSGVCTIRNVNYEVADIAYDSEIWLASKDQVYIYSLLDNQRTTCQHKFTLPSSVLGLCFANERALILLDNFTILIYKPTSLTRWMYDSTLQVKRLNNTINKLVDITNINFDSIYIIYKNSVFLLNYQKASFSFDKNFLDMQKKHISTYSLCNDGIWIAFQNDTKLYLYDKLLTNNLQVLNITNCLMDVIKITSYTSLYCSNKFMWIGSSDGLIICISITDVLYAPTGSLVPIYFSTNSFQGEVTHLLAFQNIHGVSVHKKIDCKLLKSTFNDRHNSHFTSGFNRTMSSPLTMDSYRRSSDPYKIINNKSLINLKNNNPSTIVNPDILHNSDDFQSVIPNIVLAFGKGWGKRTISCNKINSSFSKNEFLSLSCSYIDINYSSDSHAALLTFLE